MRLLNTVMVVLAVVLPVELTGQSWSRIAVPELISQHEATYKVEPDGYLYSIVRSGTRPNLVNSVLRTPASQPGEWTDISGRGLPTAPLFLGAMGMMPNGTLLVVVAKGEGGLADVMWWNGSTKSPVWEKVKGWDGISSSYIYNFTNDSAGYTYFSPAWSGDIWRNNRPNSIHFSKIASNLYSVTRGGASGHPTTGGIYALKVFNIGDGKGDMMWACGEGELDNISLKFTPASNTAFLTTADGYSGNCTAIDRSPATILALRTSKSFWDRTPTTLNSIDIATRKVKTHPSPYPQTATSFPPNIHMDAVDTLHWITGKTWMISTRDSNDYKKIDLLISRDDGETWTDLTAEGGLDESCKGSNLAFGAVSNDKYVFARCQSGRVLWRYGPF